jgi:hypothetical protein
MHAEGAGSSATWGTTGAGWNGSFDSKRYAIQVDSNELGSHGTLNLD